MKPIRIIVAGSRSINNYEFVREVILKTLCEWKIFLFVDDIEFVSGGCRTGVDSLGERFAKINEYEPKLFLPDWSIGPRAGPLRNAEMAKYATHLILIWDGKSNGSASMLREAKSNFLTIKECKVSNV
jgi:hypothetical protein